MDTHKYKTHFTFTGLLFLLFLCGPAYSKPVAHSPVRLAGMPGASIRDITHMPEQYSGSRIDSEKSKKIKPEY